MKTTSAGEFGGLQEVRCNDSSMARNTHSHGHWADHIALFVLPTSLSSRASSQPILEVPIPSSRPALPKEVMFVSMLNTCTC